MNKTRILSIFRQLTYILLAVAIGFMLFQYFTNLSFWRDEASLANNIVTRDFSGLWEHLDYGQAAPIGFLMLTEAVSTVFGTSEYALRLIPLLYGILGAFLFMQMGRLLSPQALIFSIALLATSPLYLRYAAEFKQYIGDAVWAIAIMIFAFRVLQAHDRNEKPPWIAFTAVGCIAVWFSHPAIFVMAGIGIVLLIHSLYQRNYGDTKKLIIVGILWMISFAAVYLTHYQHVAGGTDVADSMNEYWQYRFVRLDAASIIKSLMRIVVYLGGYYRPIQWILVGVGLSLAVVTYKKVYVALLLIPIPFLFAASILELYPIAGRMTVFLMPNMMILTGIGLWQLIKPIMDKSPRMAGILITVILTMILFQVRLPITSNDTTEAREALAWINTVGEDEPLYLTMRFITISRYYGTDFYLLGEDPWPTDSDSYIMAESLPDASDQRYWVISDASPDDSAIPEGDYTEYDDFLSATIFCVPGANDPCPEAVK